MKSLVGRPPTPAPRIDGRTPLMYGLPPFILAEEALLERLATERAEAKVTGDFGVADALRRDLEGRGWEIRLDGHGATASGVHWAGRQMILTLTADPGVVATTSFFLTRGS